MDVFSPAHSGDNCVYEIFERKMCVKECVDKGVKTKMSTAREASLVRNFVKQLQHEPRCLPASLLLLEHEANLCRR